MFGSKEDDVKSKVYIGEGEGCYTRIKLHNRKKYFWTHGIIITTKTDAYTKTGGKYVVHYCLDKTKEINRYTADNDK